MVLLLVSNIYFHQAKEDDAAQSDLLSAAECYKKKRAWFSAAKALEQAITISLNKKHFSENEEKSAFVALISNINEQNRDTASHQEQIGCKILLKEVRN